MHVVMTKLVFAGLATGALLLGAGPLAASAKGGPLAVTPDSGAPGTEVVVSSDYWAPSAPVEVWAASSPTRDAVPQVYAGPIAKATSDASGHWSVRLRIQDWPGLVLPASPAFLSFRATSPAAGKASAPTEGVTDFALVVGGRRPDGAGGVRLTILGRPALAFLDWERAGSDIFYITHVGPFGPPLRDYAIGWLADGDWDLVVPSTDVPVSATGGRVMTVQATLCASASIPCAPRPGPLTVVRVPIRDGRMVDVTITMGDRSPVRAAPATGTGALGASRRGAALVWMLASAGALAIAAGIVARRAHH